jgi:hypothetical protein
MQISSIVVHTQDLNENDTFLPWTVLIVKATAFIDY